MKYRDSRQAPDSGFSLRNPERIVWVASVILTGMLANASAQPASTAPKADTPGKDKTAAPSKTEVRPVNEKPSRYVNGKDANELAAYLESKTSVFTVKKRVTDPFGLAQDPDRPIIKPPTVDPKGPRTITKIPVTPFSDIIRLLKVTTIMPMEKRFLIGNKSYGQGQRFAVSFRSKNIDVEVISVSSRQITFRNVESGETASIDLNLLPPGVFRGNGNITAPGMIRETPNAPIPLDGGAMPFDNSQNR